MGLPSRQREGEPPPAERQGGGDPGGLRSRIREVQLRSSLKEKERPGHRGLGCVLLRGQRHPEGVGPGGRVGAQDRDAPPSAGEDGDRFHLPPPEGALPRGNLPRDGNAASRQDGHPRPVERDRPRGPGNFFPRSSRTFSQRSSAWTIPPGKDRPFSGKPSKG